MSPLLVLYLYYEMIINNRAKKARSGSRQQHSVGGEE